MTALFGPQETLKFVKVTKHQGAQQEEESKANQSEKVLYPFFGHVDFSLVPKTNSGNFIAKICKLQNGLFRFESSLYDKKTNTFSAKIYASVVKSGCRFQDELVELQIEG